MNSRRSILLTWCAVVFSVLPLAAQVQHPAMEPYVPVAPPRLRLMSPVAGPPETVVPTRPVFSWISVPGALGYVLQVSADSTFATCLINDTLGVIMSTPGSRSLLPHATYCWRVCALTDAGEPVCSDTVWIRTGGPPVGRSFVIADSRREEWNTAVTVIRNDNSYPVTVDSALVHPRFQIETRMPCVVAAGDSMILLLRYRPGRFGDEADTVWLAGEDGRTGVPFVARCSPPVLVARMVQATLGPCSVTDSVGTTLEFANAGPFNKLTVRRIRTRTQFFSASFLPVRMLEPGEVLRVPVKFHVRAFKSDAFGTYTDTCLVESDGGEGRVVLRGESPSPRAWTEPQVLSFGDVAAGDTAVAVLRIMNRSVNELRVDSVGTRTRSVRALLTRGRIGRTDTLQIPFRFIAGRHGTFTDTVTVANNSWWGPVRIPVVARIPYPVLECGMDRVDFGTVRKNDTAGVVIRLANGSISPLRLDSIRARTRAFRFTRPALPATLHRGDTLSFTLYFFPDSVRNFSDTLTIISTAQGGAQRIVLTGNGAPPGAAAIGNPAAGQFELFQNFPNPFRESTTFRYVLPEPGHVRLEIFTTLGQQVALLVDGEQDAGFHNVTWSTTVTSGVYYYRLVATPRSDPGKQYKGTRKMVVMR